MPRTVPDTAILNAALEVMAQHGYAGATTRQIAVAAGINEVTLFRRFGSKKELLIAAVEQEAEYFKGAGTEYTGDLQADLLGIVRFYRRVMEQRGPVIAMLLSEVPRQPELLEVLQTPLTIVGKVTALLERYQKEGRLIQEPPMQAFLALAGPIFLSGIITVMQPEVPFDPAEHVSRYLQGRRQ